MNVYFHTGALSKRETGFVWQLESPYFKTMKVDYLLNDGYYYYGLRLYVAWIIQIFNDGFLFFFYIFFNEQSIVAIFYFLEFITDNV